MHASRRARPFGVRFVPSPESRASPQRAAPDVPRGLGVTVEGMSIDQLGVRTGIPAPPFESIPLGPVSVHLYALCILAGVAVAVVLARRTVAERGLDPEFVTNAALVVVPAGVLGGRAYHLLTDRDQYRDASALDLAAVWNGGLGIWGAVALGVLAAYLYWRSHRARFGAGFGVMADAIAPGLAAAQCIGRWGNWWNQELYGSPTTMPWGWRLDADVRDVAGIDNALVHPTFLYESLGMALLAAWLWRTRRSCTPAGNRFARYLIGYGAVRLVVEGLRVDPSSELVGLRWNMWMAAAALACGSAVVVWRERATITNRALAAFIVGGVLVVDQLTKVMAIAELNERRVALPFGFGLELYRNPGAAFSTGEGVTIVFTTIAVLATAIGGWALVRVRQRADAVLIAVALGGVVGNLVDRLWRAPAPGRGHVVDFLAVPNFAVCNLADVALSAAAVVAVTSALRNRQDES